MLRQAFEHDLEYLLSKNKDTKILSSLIYNLIETHRKELGIITLEDIEIDKQSLQLKILAWMKNMLGDRFNMNDNFLLLTSLTTLLSTDKTLIKLKDVK